jgi:hypothetical protein
VTDTQGQNWTFVGPYSNNNLNGDEFETGQMNRIVYDNVSGKLFAASRYGGLWQSSDDGANWSNINMAATGLDQSGAIAVKNSSELLVGNYHFSKRYCFSNRVSTYNHVNNTWTNYPSLPATGTFVINCVAVHPANQSIVYAGTSQGLFRYNGSTWSLVEPNCTVHAIVFLNNTTCFISGTNQASNVTNFDIPVGHSMVRVSTDPGNSVFSGGFFTGTLNSCTNICKGIAGGNAAIYAVTWTHPSQARELKKITGTSTFTETLIHSWTDDVNLAGWRMPIMYDYTNNWVWLGAQVLECYDLNASAFHYAVQKSWTGHTTGGLIHDDMHGFCVDYATNEIFIAHDGGVAKGSLNFLNTPTDIYFNRANNNINIALVNGFSGSELHPNIYAIGCQDIVNNDIYDEFMQRNLYTHHAGSENDGAFIDKYNDQFMLLDNSSYNNQVDISNDEGFSKSGDAKFYIPDPNPPFTANLSTPDNPVFDFGMQRTVQDPYRPKRIFEIARTQWCGYYQYDFSKNAFASKGWFNYYSPGLDPSKITWYQTLIDLSFSPETKNSLYWITNNRADLNTASIIMKYIGPDIDDSWDGHNSNWYTVGGNPWNPQWQNISPNWATFSSVGGGAVNITGSDVGKAGFQKVVTSPWNKNVVYVACNINDQGPNQAIKVLKYDGTNWTDYSQGIPANEIVSNMVLDYFSDDALYLATEQHVYYRARTGSSWVQYGTGLPGQMVTQMEINYHENTVRVGTYGRGIWKAPLKCPTMTSWPMTGPIPPMVYEANTITANGQTNLPGYSAPTAFRATQSVTWNPGFKAIPPNTNNNYVYAIIHGCSTAGSSHRIEEADEYFDWYANQDIKGEVSQNLVAYPNPTNGEFNIAYKLDELSKGTIVITNVIGARIKTINISNASDVLRMELNDQPSGTYFISIYNEDKLIKTQKLLITK